MQTSDSFVVTGGRHLKGELIPQGAKNEALQVICASLLTDQPVTINNLPDILDVRHLLELIKGLGVKVTCNDPHSYTMEAANVNLEYFGTTEFQSHSPFGPVESSVQPAIVAANANIARRRMESSVSVVRVWAAVQRFCLLLLHDARTDPQRALDHEARRIRSHPSGTPRSVTAPEA